MDQSILLVRNPRAAIPSYHTLRYEINYSKTWAESFAWKNFTYTKRPSIDSWVSWRDARFNRQIDLWGRLIDFWMKDGQRKGPNSTYYQDHHCSNINYMVPCTPKTVIQFEKLVSPDPQEGAVETDKIAAVLESSPNVDIMEPDGRPCIHEKVLLRKEFYNANRDGNGPDPTLKRFEYWQVAAMKQEVMRVRDDYKKSPWDSDPQAQMLVAIMEEYVAELQEEYDLEWSEWNQKYGEEAQVMAEAVIAEAVAAEAEAAAMDAAEAAIAEDEAEAAAEAAALEALEAEAAAAALEADALEAALAAAEARVVAQEAADAALEVERAAQEAAVRALPDHVAS